MIIVLSLLQSAAALRAEPATKLTLDQIIDRIEERYAGSGFAANFFQESTLKEMDITDIILRNMNNSNNQNVGLTEQEINDVCRYCTFNEFPIMIRNRYTTCPITLDDFNNDSQVSIIRNCGHVFSRAALNNWLTRHST